MSVYVHMHFPIRVHYTKEIIINKLSKHKQKHKSLRWCF